MPEGKQILGSGPDQAVRVVATITGLSYGWKGEQNVPGQEQTLEQNSSMGSERNVFRAVGGCGYLIITLFLLLPETDGTPSHRGQTNGFLNSLSQLPTL